MTSGLLLLATRLMLAAMFLASGLSVLSDIEAGARYFAALDLPFPLLVAWGVGLFETAAGAALVVGIQTRMAAVLLALFSLAATFIGHYGEGQDPVLAFMHGQMLLKDVAVAGGLIALAIHGPGRLSVDGLFGSKLW